jgi:hypothetical protein
VGLVRKIDLLSKSLGLKTGLLAEPSDLNAGRPVTENKILTNRVFSEKKSHSLLFIIVFVVFLLIRLNNHRKKCSYNKKHDQLSANRDFLYLTRNNGKKSFDCQFGRLKSPIRQIEWPSIYTRWPNN